MHPRPRLSARRVVLGLAIGLLILVGAGIVQPYPQHQEGAVVCLPFLGPRLRLRPGLADSAEARVRVHEAVHMEQCHREGSLGILRAQWSRSQRLRLEAEAGCREAEFSWRRGRRADHAFEDLVDALLYGMPRGLQPTPEAARAAAAAACPRLRAAARSRMRPTEGHVGPARPLP